MNIGDKITIVYTVTNPDEAKDYWRAHFSGGSLYGLSPEILAGGDHVAILSDILTRLSNIDPMFPDKKELKDLCELAEKHIKGEK